MSETPHLLAYFFEKLRENSDSPLIAERRGTLYHWLSWKEAAQAMSDAVRGLQTIGIERGQRVAMIAPHHTVELLLLECAALALGGLVVTLPSNAPVEDQVQAIEKSQSSIVVTNQPQILEALAKQAAALTHLKQAILLTPKPFALQASFELHRWTQLKEQGKSQPDRLPVLLKQLTPKDNVTLIYSRRELPALMPKLFSHHLLAALTDQIVKQVGVEHFSRKRVVASLLPFNHPLTRPVCLFLPVFHGIQQYFMEDSREELLELSAIAPEILIAESSFFLRLKEKLISEARKEGAAVYAQLQEALEMGKKRYESPKLGFWDRFRQFMGGDVAVTRVRRKLGGKLKLMISVDGKLPYDAMLFFQTFSITHIDLDEDSLGLSDDPLTALKRIDRGQAAPSLLG